MRIFKLAVLGTLCILFSNIAVAQNDDAKNTFSPYSFYGIGDLATSGFTSQRGMGGIGIGLRTNRAINYMNPAALSVQDTLSFMFDFGAEMQNYYLSTHNNSTASNSFNMHHIAMSFPVWNKMVLALSVMPYSNVGYNVKQKETNPAIINEVGDITYTHQGEGGLNQVMMSLGYSLRALFPNSVLSRFSVGAQAQYIFGSIDRYSNITFTTDPSNANVNSGQHIKANNFTFGLGLQYDMPIKDKYHLTVGATYLFKNDMSVRKIDFAYRNGGWGTDTTRYDVDDNALLSVPASIGFGATIKNGDKWLVGFDYTYRNWSNTAFEVNNNTAAAKSFKATPEHMFRAGFETTPNRNDIRYFFKRWTYRAGLYYEQTYMKFGDTQINNYGMTFGVGVPLGTRNNAINISTELGQRGTLDNDLIRETYWKISVGVSLYDIWFVKQRFE